MTEPVTIVPIVEGHGEVFAVPVLLRRLVELFAPTLNLRVARPIRRSRDRLLQEGELEKDVNLAAETIAGFGAVLILIDSEGECPAELGKRVTIRARAAREDRIIRVSVAHQEYEAWFVVAAQSLAGSRGLRTPLVTPALPEEIRGAKEWLRKNMSGSRTYSETADQPALTAKFDIAQARITPSFDRFCRVCQQLFEELLTLSSSV